MRARTDRDHLAWRIGALRVQNDVMHRFTSIALIAGALVLLVAGSVFAAHNPVADAGRSPFAASHGPSASPDPDQSEAPESQAPESEAPESEAPESQAPESEAPEADSSQPPTQAVLDDLVARLDAAGISADSAQLAALVEKYGVGGAIRVIAWADAMGDATDTSQIEALRDQGMGWGAIAQQLNADDSSLHLAPGIGWIMSAGHAGSGLPDAAQNGKQKSAGHGKATAPGQAGRH